MGAGWARRLVQVVAMVVNTPALAIDRHETSKTIQKTASVSQQNRTEMLGGHAGGMGWEGKWVDRHAVPSVRRRRLGPPWERCIHEGSID